MGTLALPIFAIAKCWLPMLAVKYRRIKGKPAVLYYDQPIIK